MKRIRLRNNAALYNGNIKGPKESRNSGSDDAGWKGVRAGLDASSTIASLNARLRCKLSGRSLNRRLTGDSSGESADMADASFTRISKLSQ